VIEKKTYIRIFIYSYNHFLPLTKDTKDTEEEEEEEKHIHFQTKGIP